MLAHLTLLTVRHALPQELRKRLMVDVPKGIESRDLLLSDDGTMLFDFSRFARVTLPAGRWTENEALFYGSTPGSVITTSQGGGQQMASFMPVASPGPNRALILVWERGRNQSINGPRTYLVLLRYDRRGAQPNESVQIAPGQITWRRSLNAGLYEVGCFNAKTRKTVVYWVDTRGSRLTARKIGATPPEAYPSGPHGYSIGTAFSSEGLFLAETKSSGGRQAVREWSSKLRRWKELAAPVDQRSSPTELLPPQLFYVGRRLYATPFPYGEAAWTYEASADHKSWRKVSDRILLTVSANQAFCLTYDAEKNDAWVERFADFVR